MTKLPYLNEIGINDDNAIFLNFDCSNIDEVVEKIKRVHKVDWSFPCDNYSQFLYTNSKSKYKELKSNMKKIKVKNKFLDMKHNNILRRVGEEFIEDNVRADDLINRGFCTLVEEIKNKTEKAVDVVETAVKEVKKEKAVKEKAIKKNVTKK